MNKTNRNIVYCSDVAGTGFWRHILQILAMNSLQTIHDILNTYTLTPILDARYYADMKSITIQRWNTPAQAELVKNFLKPIADNNQAWLIYAIDDAMHYDEIPLYNRGRAAFAEDATLQNIQSMLLASDFVIVTTDYIKNYYHKKYNVPIENIIAIPNLLPKWWFGDRYDPDKRLQLLSKNKAKPRIGIVSSLSHYNIDNIHVDENGFPVKPIKDNDGKVHWMNKDNVEVDQSTLTPITDDFDEIHDCVRSTINDFQWVFFGYCPPKLRDLADKRKIEVHRGVPILNYASYFDRLNLLAVIAPIKRMEFNYCKSHIKYMECAALGIPLFATNCLPYDRVMPTAQLFNDSNDLKQKLLKFKFIGSNAYRSMIDAQWKWLNSATKEGDVLLNNYWLEDNINIWIELCKLRAKTFNISYAKYEAVHEAKEKENAEKVIYKNDNILITK